MKIVLIGHGRMGRLIEQTAVAAGDEVAGVFDEDNMAALEKADGTSSALDPSDPSGDASSGTSSGSDSGEDVPTTGEAGNPAPWVLLMVLAGSGAAGTALYVRKRRAQ